MNDVVTLLQAIGGLIGAVAWPLIALYALVRILPQLKGLLRGEHDVQLEAPGGFKLMFTKPQVQAAAALAVADAQKASLARGGPAAPAADLVDVLQKAVPDERAQRRFEQSRILWVDDMPENNRYERAALEALGARVDAVVSTDTALAALGRGGYDVVVTDMGRPEGRHAGHDLLERMRDAGDVTPVVIYAGSATAAEVAEAKERGAVGRTAAPGELLRLVGEAVAG